MIRFECDYAEGAAPQLLERLTRTNLEQTPAMPWTATASGPGT